MHVDFPRLLIVGVSKKSKEASTLNCCVELTLIVSLRTCQASRHNLAVFLDEVAKCVDIFVIDLVNMINCEAAEFFTLEKRVLLIRVTSLPFPLAPKAMITPFRIPLYAGQVCVNAPKMLSETL